MKIQEVPIDQRPYEKFLKHGAGALTDAELLAILLKNGTKEYNVLVLANKILTQSGQSASLVSLHQLSFNQLTAVKGIGKVKALQILALLELSKRLAMEKYTPLRRVDSPQMVADYFMEYLRHLREEYFLVAILDAKCRLLSYTQVSKGSLTASIVHPREVFKMAIQRSAYSIIAVHNHPSGDPSPSKEDIELTRRLKQAGELVGIPLLDHIIIGDGRYVSLKEESYL